MGGGDGIVEVGVLPGRGGQLQQEVCDASAARVEAQVVVVVGFGRSRVVEGPVDPVLAGDLARVDEARGGRKIGGTSVIGVSLRRFVLISGVLASFDRGRCAMGVRGAGDAGAVSSSSVDEPV